MTRVFSIPKDNSSSLVSMKIWLKSNWNQKLDLGEKLSEKGSVKQTIANRKRIKQNHYICQLKRYLHFRQNEIEFHLATGYSYLST